jgi:hypothetical protein
MFEQLASASSDPETLWLILTNAVLAVVCTVCIALVGVGVARDLIARMLARRETHAFQVAGLGLTMADGGEPVKPEADKADGKHD